MFRTFHLSAPHREGAPKPKPFSFSIRQVSLDQFIVEQVSERAGRASVKQIYEPASWDDAFRFCNQLAIAKTSQGKSVITETGNPHLFTMDLVPNEKLSVHDIDKFELNSEDSIYMAMPYVKGDRVYVAFFENGDVVICHRNQPQSRVPHRVQEQLSELCRSVTATVTVMIGTLTDDSFFAQDLILHNGKPVSVHIDERHAMLQSRFMDFVCPVFRIVPLLPISKKAQLDKWRQSADTLGVLLYQRTLTPSAPVLLSYHPFVPCVALTPDAKSHTVTLAQEVNEDLVPFCTISLASGLDVPPLSDYPCLIISHDDSVEHALLSTGVV